MDFFWSAEGLNLFDFFKLVFVVLLAENRVTRIALLTERRRVLRLRRVPPNRLDCVLDTPQLQNVFFFDLVVDTFVVVFKATHDYVHVLMVLGLSLALYCVLSHQLQIESFVDVNYAEHMLNGRIEVPNVICHSSHFFLLPDDV